MNKVLEYVPFDKTQVSFDLVEASRKLEHESKRNLSMLRWTALLRLPGCDAVKGGYIPVQ